MKNKNTKTYTNKINNIFKEINKLSQDKEFQKLYKEIRNKNALYINKYEEYISDFYNNLREISHNSF